MELIINYVIALFKVLFAVPALGILILLSTFGPMIVRAVKHR